MKLFILLALTCFTNIISYGQESFIKWNNQQQLQWNDFAGKISDSSKYAAESYAEIFYRFKANNYKQFDFEVYAFFDKNASWRRREMECEDLLKHEQIHFNIAALFAEKLKQDFTSFTYSSNYLQEINEIFSRNKLQYQALQVLYDQETNHSLNKEKQNDWDNYINSQLYKTPVQLAMKQ